MIPEYNPFLNFLVWYLRLKRQQIPKIPKNHPISKPRNKSQDVPSLILFISKGPLFAFLLSAAASNLFLLTSLL